MHSVWSWESYVSNFKTFLDQPVSQVYKYDVTWQDEEQTKIKSVRMLAYISGLMQRKDHDYYDILYGDCIEPLGEISDKSGNVPVPISNYNTILWYWTRKKSVWIDFIYNNFEGMLCKRSCRVFQKLLVLPQS